MGVDEVGRGQPSWGMGLVLLREASMGFPSAPAQEEARSRGVHRLQLERGLSADLPPGLGLSVSRTVSSKFLLFTNHRVAWW